MLRNSLPCLVLAVCVSSASAQAPKPIKLWLTPAKPPTPALKYQLLPDARLATTGNAADVYHQVIELLKKKPRVEEATLMGSLLELPLNQLPIDEVRKELAAYQDVYELLDKAARCDYCEFGIRDRLRKSGIGALLPELQPLRECAQLLAYKARLEMAAGHPDQALAALRTGYALGRHVGESDTIIGFLVGVAITAVMDTQLDQFVALPNAPNLYYALTDMPAPLFTMRRGLEGERLSIYATIPAFKDLGTNLDAGNLSEKDLALAVRVVDGLSKGDEQLPHSLERFYMAMKIRDQHETAKQALIESGRPRDKIEAMPHIQVALLYSLLEYNAALDEMMVAQKLPYPELSERMANLDKRYVKDRWKNPKAAAVPLASLLLPAVQKVAFAGARMERKFALLRTIEALRLYAAEHNGALPHTLAAIKNVPLPLDPVTGKSFEYRLDGELARLYAPVPAGQTPNTSNHVTYEMKIRKR